MRFCPRPTSRAFTLVELLMVMVMLAVIAAAVAPSLRGFGVGRSRANFASTIAGLTEYAHTQAVSEGRQYRLNVDAGGRTVWLTADNGDGAFGAAKNDYGERYTAAANINFSADVPPRDDGSGSYVQFLPTGRTEAATFRITDGMGGETDVACASPTEMFRVLKPGEAIQ